MDPNNQESTPLRPSPSQIITIIVTLITLTINILANALPLNGQTTGEISDRFNALFVPAGYVFAIWGLIYLGLITYTIFQALPTQREHELLNKIAPFFWIASVANSIWIVLWHYEYYEWTLVAMSILLFSLILLYLQISKARSGLDQRQWWLIQAPFSIYLGWISVATIANFSQILWGYGWAFDIGPLYERNLAIVMIFVAAILGLAMLWREKDYLYTGVLVWSLVGIAVEKVLYPGVANTAWSAAGLLVLALVAFPFIDRAEANG